MWEWEASFFSPGEQQRLPATWLMQTSIYSLLLLLSEAAQRTHMERREKKRREQSAKVHSHHTRTPHTHHVWSQWAKEVYWSFQQEEVEWKQEKNNSKVMKQGHRFNCIDVFCGDRNISVPLLSGSSDIWPLYCCWRVKISEILRPRGFILCAHAESLKKHDMTAAGVVLTLLSWLFTGRRTTPCLILSIISFTAFDFTSSTPSAAGERILLYIIHI